MNFGIISNSKKDADNIKLKEVYSALESKGCSILFSCEFSETASLEKDVLEKCSFVYVLGGDGTIMTAARMLAGFDIGIIGVNTGHLGFLAELTADKVGQSVDHIKQHRYTEDRRFMIECETNGKKAAVALNDIVISHDNVSKLIDAEISIDGSFVDSYKCDGLIVSTPTGSTAYSLAAGGPVVSPKAECIIITPICPFSLASKPIIINDSEALTIRLRKDSALAMLSSDGRTVAKLDSDCVCRITKSETNARFIRFSDMNFFRRLTEKMNKI